MAGRGYVVEKTLLEELKGGTTFSSKLYSLILRNPKIGHPLLHEVAAYHNIVAGTIWALDHFLKDKYRFEKQQRVVVLQDALLRMGNAWVFLLIRTPLHLGLRSLGQVEHQIRLYSTHLAGSSYDICVTSDEHTADSHVNVDVRRCFFQTFFSEMSTPHLVDIVCQWELEKLCGAVDPVRDSLRIVRKSRIPAGHDKCTFCVFRKVSSSNQRPEVCPSP
eukprot:CAMPEP_0119137268 /NCGR_PEP_ID=MMETSP1310-20130426/23270_1 /TAXON_ID=464262 /ORGANISM="Genus nov. species nov., Strain RCC2339" /LENGTH=218 /DNA_ID=CAMNT_0007128337 /DNA_START=220 /DNA_END=876 /DNA_ORIENTATION=+